MKLQALRHRLPEHALRGLDRNPLGDAPVAADELYQDAGEKRRRARRPPEGPPRRRANKRRGQGTFDNERRPVAGVVGRRSGEVRLEVIANADRATLEEGIDCTRLGGTLVSSDEWCGNDHLPARRRGDATVCYAAGEWARDDDGDGVREVHVKTLEGLGTGLRNSLRRFQGVSEWYLAQDVAVFPWSYNLKHVTDEFLRCPLGRPAQHRLGIMSRAFFIGWQDAENPPTVTRA